MKFSPVYAIFFAALILFLPATGSANLYPETVENGNLICVDGGMGVGKYADKTSVVVEENNSSICQLAINIVPVTFSEEHFRRYGTYEGGAYNIGEPFLLRFRYDIAEKILYYERTSGKWLMWDVNRDYSHAEGNPLIPNAADVAFAAVFNKKFF